MQDSIINNLWVEKYRPKTINEYVFKNEELQMVAKHLISVGNLSNLAFYGPPGTGKTSLIHILINSISKIDPADILELNMSDEGVDAIRDKVLPFVVTKPCGEYKIVILEEFEMCSLKGQNSLKRVIEDYSSNARFLITSNQPNKIQPAIRSRMQEITIERHDMEQFMGRIVDILCAENVVLDTEEKLQRVNKYIQACYPDFRKCINTLQQNCINNEIIELNSATSGTTDYKYQIVNAIKSGSLSQARDAIVKSIKDDEISSFFTFLYQNVDIWIPEKIDAGTKEILKMTLILKIREGLVKDTLCADRECNLSATLCDLQLTVIESTK